MGYGLLLGNAIKNKNLDGCQMTDVNEIAADAVQEPVPEDALHFLMAIWVFFIVMTVSLSCMAFLGGRAQAAEPAKTAAVHTSSQAVSGQAMALSLMLGIHTAVGPVEETPALKIAKYRHQQKEEDLRVISMLDAENVKALRWSRD